MRKLGFLIFMGALAASPAAAQGPRSSQGIPPGQLPPAGMCRVWYDDLPPGRQPRATNCNDAERVASRDRHARVIYGDTYDRNDRNDRWGNGRYDNDRDRYDDRNGRGYGVNNAAYDTGYRDGLNKGREDARDRDSFDPVRHKEYRNADRGYNGRYGSKDQYKLVYREAFEAGYRQAYRDNGGRLPGNNQRYPNRWP